MSLRSITIAIFTIDTTNTASNINNFSASSPDNVEQIAEQLTVGLTGLGNQIKRFKTLRELRYAEDLELLTIDALVIIASGDNQAESALLLLAELRSQSDLRDMPLVMLSSNITDGLLSRIYLESADVVLPIQTSSTEINLLLRSLQRKQKERRQLLELSTMTEQRELAIYRTLQGVTDPVVVLSKDYSVYWLNPTAIECFGITAPESQETMEFINSLSKALCGCISYTVSKQTALDTNSNQIEKQSVLIETLNGNREWWHTTIFPVQAYNNQGNNSKNEEYNAFVVYLKPSSLNDVVTQRAQQLAQMEAMALKAASCAHTVLEKTSSGIVVSPYLRISEHLSKSETRSDVNSVLTSLLEYLDPIISPEITITVKVPSAQSLNMPFHDTFELIGHMLFNAINFVFWKGEISVECGEHQPGSGTTLLMTARSSNRARLLTTLNKELVTNELKYADPELINTGGELPSRFTRIRDLTTRYRTELLFQTKGDDTLRLKVLLPSNAS